MYKSRLTVKHLETVHAIESADTLTRAAELLNISQPATSSRLNDAEQILGTPLFSRRGRRLSITPAGRLVSRSARIILAELRRVEGELSQLSDETTGSLRIGMPQYASFAWLPDAVREFEKRFPNTVLEIVSEAAMEPRHALARGEIDVAIFSSPNRRVQVDTKKYRCRRLLEDEFVALLPKGHRKSRRDYLDPEDFIDETYITNSAKPERNREYELFFHPNSVHPERVIQVGFTGAILQLIGAGIGTTIITRWILHPGDLRSSIVTLPLTRAGLRVYWYAISSRAREVDEQSRALCGAITDHATTLQA